jgi:pyridoxine/pyridoxamine 5'-phosphate oxidase
MAMEDLQRAIDSSLVKASPLARRIYANDRWPAISVQRFINKVMAATVATVRSDGRPHAAVVLTACMDGTVYLTASVGSVLLRNLRQEAAISMTIADRDHDLTIHGRAEPLGKAADLPDLLEELHGLSRRGQFIPRNWDGYLYAVGVERIFLSR